MIVTLAGSAQAFLDDPGRANVARRGLSLALAGVAVWMLWRTSGGWARQTRSMIRSSTAMSARKLISQT